MLADKLPLEINRELDPKLASVCLSCSLAKISLELCSTCYNLVVIMFHDDSEENRFYLTRRGADVGLEWH